MSTTLGKGRFINFYLVFTCRSTSWESTFIEKSGSDTRRLGNKTAS